MARRDIDNIKREHDLFFHGGVPEHLRRPPLGDCLDQATPGSKADRQGTTDVIIGTLDLRTGDIILGGHLPDDEE